MHGKMTMRQYQKKAMRTSPRDGHDKIDNGVLGLIGETGELVDLWKKYKYQSTDDAELPRAKLAEELGDVLWYLAELADGMGEELLNISGKDFCVLDARFGNPGGRTHSVRKLVTGLAWRASRLCRAADTVDAEELRIQIRRMLAGAARLAWRIGYSLEEVAAMNIAKLEKRYPEGFDPEISMGRYEK